MESLVADIMETEVVTVGENQSMKTVGTRLYQRDIGSIIIHSEEGVPVGIITPTDILQAIAESSPRLSDIPATEYMSRPLLTIEPDQPVRSAVRRMNDEGIEQLAIVDEYEVVGIISRNGVVDAYESLIKAAHEAEQKPKSR